jgi:hypothetical protein
MKTKDKKIIEDSERDMIPIFVLTAKDLLSVKGINLYLTQCKHNLCSKEHCDNVRDRLVEFKAWQKNYPDKVKMPD